MSMSRLSVTGMSLTVTLPCCGSRAATVRSKPHAHSATSRATRNICVHDRPPPGEMLNSILVRALLIGPDDESRRALHLLLDRRGIEVAAVLDIDAARRADSPDV